jgi:hypothetical protein
MSSPYVLSNSFVPITFSFDVTKQTFITTCKHVFPDSHNIEPNMFGVPDSYHGAKIEKRKSGLFWVFTVIPYHSGNIPK